MSLFNQCVRLLILSTIFNVPLHVYSANNLSPLPKPELAKIWQAEQDPSRYLISEKLDGVRARWDGQQLYSRSGLRIDAPDWFIKNFPNEALEGELWGGYGSFDHVSLIARGLTANDDWHSLQYWLFDAPTAAGGFEQRYQHFAKFDRLTPYLRVIPQQLGTTAEALQQQLASIVSQGGEGLILHQRDAPAVEGRSPYVFKLKPVDDAEAKVLAILPGKGKYQGMMGSLLVEMENGTQFKIGSGFSDAQRQSPPSIGSWVTFAHNGFTSGGKPRFARFIRVRLDYDLSHDAQ